MPNPSTTSQARAGRLGEWTRNAGRDLNAAWRDGRVRRGLLATILISLGALSPAYLPRSTPLWRILDGWQLTGTGMRIAGTLATMGGMLLLVDAWFKLRPRPGGQDEKFVYHHLRHWAILLIWGAPMLLAPPIFSHDAYSYAAQGWLLHNGINPYEAGPSVLPGPFADQVSWVWRNTVAPYGPLSLQIQRLLVEASGFNPYLAAVLQRIPALLGVVAIGLLVPRVANGIGKDPAFAAWFATLNPLLVIDFIGGAHNDSLMIGLVIVAAWVAGLPSRRRAAAQSHWWLLAAVIVGIAAAIKQPAFLAAYALPLIRRPWRDFSAREVAVNGSRILISCATAIGSFALVSWATGLGLGWLNAVGVPGLVVTIAPFMIIGYLIQIVLDWFNLDPTNHAAIRYSRTVGMIVAAISVGWLALTEARNKPHSFLAKAYLVVAICAPALRSWYLLWGGLLIPWADFERKAIRASVWLSLMLLCYDGIVMSWRNDAMAFGVALAGGIWWIARSAERSMSRAAHPSQISRDSRRRPQRDR